MVLAAIHLAQDQFHQGSMSTVFQSAAEARVLVGYLAEQYAAWFSSQFFGPRASAFLVPVFARTAFQAQCHGATAAAASVHEDAIGIGRKGAWPIICRTNDGGSLAFSAKTGQWQFGNAGSTTI